MKLYDVICLVKLFVCQSTLSKTMDATPMDLDLTFVATYDPKYGIKVGIKVSSQQLL